ncbi:hypothetical protein KZC51_04110 [Microbacterium sp. SSW1-49]|uniref:DUF7882 domain-containing protein n=1 Tax=Microbacterium croceum TaxID=2851645 RepID=A0ABT0FBA1_9MICO|nr:hypothetical protein [Microbacterium croceum]MCK2035313.1 hypothetical protein [Microbacterium croceum]
MGYLNYAGAPTSFTIDDEMLAHVRAVVVTKLRRSESFALTIPTIGAASETLWIHASIPLRFSLVDDVPLGRPLLVAMMEAASSSGGLDLTDERLARSLGERSFTHAMSA